MRKRFLPQRVCGWINKHKHSINNVSVFRVVSFNAFWKFFWLGNWAWDFLRVKFWSRESLFFIIYLFIYFFWGGGGLFEALGIFWGFDFCPHSIIHVTWNPEYLPNENAFLLLIVMTLYPGWSRNKKIVLRTHIIIKSPSEPARKCGDIKLQSSSNIKLWFKDSWRPCGNEVLRVKWTTSFPILVKRIWKLLILFGPLFCLFVIEYSALDVVSSLFQK